MTKSNTRTAFDWADPMLFNEQLTEEEQMMPALNAHHYIENYKKYKNIK